MKNTKFYAYIQLMRIKQWVKNLFVFVAAFFSGKVLEGDVFLNSLYAFLLFSLVASAVYVINDIADVEKDRLHPTKKNRPIAAAKIKISNAWILLFILIGATVFGLLLFANWQLAGILVVYFVMNILYSFKLKQVAIVDIFIIAFGFLLRVLAGGAATGLQITDWAILLNFVLALVLAAGKRRGELKNLEITGVTRKALAGYSVNYLDIILAISSTVAIVCYIMFIVSPEVQERFHHNIIYTVVFVIFGIFRYLQLALVFDNSESPTKILYQDNYIRFTVLLWLVAFLLLIYFR